MTCVCWCALVILAAASACGAESAASSEAKAKAETPAKAKVKLPEPVIPKRQIEYDVSEEEYPVRLTAPNAKLIQQRYVAVFEVVGTGPSGISGEDREAHSEFFALRFRSTLHPDTRLPREFRRERTYRALHDLHRMVFEPSRGTEFKWRQLVENVPPGQLPPDDVVSLLTTKAGLLINSRTFETRADDEGRKYRTRIEILAPTPQRARELTEGYLRLLDYGLQHPLLQQALYLKQTYQERLPELRDALKMAEENLAPLQKALDGLKQYEDITEEALGNFITQQRLIGIDLVGIQARIDACNKILGAGAEKSLTASRRDQVETVKITAEIELVGLAARRDAIRKIVEKGRRRQGLLSECSGARNRVRHAEISIEQTERRIADYEAEYLRRMPCPIGGKVRIRRIKWETK